VNRTRLASMVMCAFLATAALRRRASAASSESVGILAAYLAVAVTIAKRHEEVERREAQHLNLKLVDVAQHLADTGDLPA
jgi:hypothetical protein